jgi:DNA helicase-2/ATP-dependent DNA helicase PcrA
MAKISGLTNVETGGPQGPAAPPPWTPSAQQEAIFQFVSDPSAGSAQIVAVAGSGKTTTLVEASKRMYGGAAFMAYNKKIAEEIGFKLSDAGIDYQRVKSGTCHSFGFAALKKIYPKTRVTEDKTSRLMAGAGVPKNLQPFVRQLVSMGKQYCFGLLLPMGDWTEWNNVVEKFDMQEKLYTDDEDMSSDQMEDLINQGIEWTQKIMTASLSSDDMMIDFDDMIYSPLVHGAPFWRYKWVLLDEAQDTNPARRLLAKKMLMEGGRIIAVGDPRQAIYGFTGADSDALEIIRSEFNCTSLPLTVSYRCPKAVVRHAQRWVSHIEAAPNAIEGSVRQIDEREFKRKPPQRGDAILCRLTQPLIKLAFEYIRQRVPAHVEGRDIGQNLISLIKKWRSAANIGELRDKLDEYWEEESLKLAQKNQNAKLAQLEDRVGSVRVIISMLPDDADTGEAEKLVESIFKDSVGRTVTGIILSTVHKAKGREWDTVYLYGRNKWMPHSFATQEWQIEQENNLIYVAVTRAKKELIEVKVY